MKELDRVIARKDILEVQNGELIIEKAELKDRQEKAENRVKELDEENFRITQLIASVCNGRMDIEELYDEFQ